MKMTAEEIAKWQADHLTPEVKAEAEYAAMQYEEHDYINFTFLDELISLAGLGKEIPVIESESDVNQTIDLAMQAAALLGVRIRDDHVDMDHHFCADCGCVVRDNDPHSWDEDGNVYCWRHTPHEED